MTILTRFLSKMVDGKTISRISIVYQRCSVTVLYIFSMSQAFTKLANINSKIKLENSQKCIRDGINNPI